MRGGKKRRRWLLIIPAALLCAVVAAFAPRLEGEDPRIEIRGLGNYIGETTSFTVSVSDSGTGLRSVSIVLRSSGREFPLVDERFSGKGGKTAEPVMNKEYSLTVEPKRMGITDGPAVITIRATDLSVRNWFSGNISLVEKSVVVDTKKPDVSVISRTHYVTEGGSCLVVYRVMEEGTTHGVQVGDTFYPGCDGLFADKTVCVAFFAIDCLKEEEPPMLVVATDRAGNRTKAGFYYHVRQKRFASDTINISDAFLNMKMPEFDVPPGFETPIDRFVWINSVQREKDVEKIKEICGRSDCAVYWKGAFLRFPNSARRAGFGDRRQYLYNGKVVSNAVHMGVDLASVSHSPVPAANSGRVAFAGTIGIFGKTVVIDHGAGLFSMYSHLSSITAKQGSMVSKGENIGISGMTGLAGGDHLHFGMLVRGTFVDPVEWWDGTWIDNNITSKLEPAKAKIKG